MITSSNNQQMKNIMQLQKKSKTRQQQRVFVVEGPKMVFEAPREWVEKVYVAESFFADEAAGTSSGSDYEYETVSDAVFRSISDTQTPQGILALVRMPEYTLSDLLGRKEHSPNGENGNRQMEAVSGKEGKMPHLLILESIQDPGNLGTMLRTGEGAGITGVILNRTTVDLFNPKTIRSTMGSLYRVPFYVADDLERIICELKEQGIKVYAAHLRGTKSYDEPDYTKGTAFLIGNEGNGLTDETAALADEYIRIPMEGKVESLNAAIAAALLTYEVNRQRRI